MRQTDGLMSSIAKLLGVDIAVPGFPSLSRRGNHLTLRVQPEGQSPILANRIKYYESAEILKIRAAQQGQHYPFPAADPVMTMTQVRAAVAAAQAEGAEAALRTEAAIVQIRSAKTAASAEPAVVPVR